jgi:hypothetical protein
VGSVGHGARGLAKRYRRWLIAAGALLLIYTVAGFLLAPWILHRQLERRLAAALHREVTIERVRVNPFALSVTLDGLLVKERDGSPFVSWQRLYLRGRLLPVIKRELDLDTLHLVRFRARVTLARDGTLNFSDIMASFSSPEPATAPQPPEKKGGFVFGIDHLALDEAQIDFTDLSRARPFRSTVGPFTIRLDQFRARPGATSPYAFTGTTESGEKFSWSGSVKVEPIRSTGTLALEGIRLPKYSPYYEQNVGFELSDGSARVQGSYELEWGPARRVVRVFDASLVVRSLVVRLPDLAAPKIEQPELDVTGVAVDVLQRNAHVESVALRGGTVRMRRGSDGRFDIERLTIPRGQSAPAGGPPTATAPPAPPAPAPAPAPKAQPFRWTVAKVAVTEERIEVDDALPARPVRVLLAPLSLTLGRLSSDRAAQSTLQLATGWNDKGRIQVDGTFSLWRPSAELTLHVESLDLPAIDPYLALYGNLDARFGDGRLGIDGHLKLDLAPDPPLSAFEGDVAVDSFSLLDVERGQELARWRSLRISGIKFASQPEGMTIRSVRWSEPRARIQIAADGSSNVKRILRIKTVQGESDAPKAEAKAPPPPPPAAERPFPVAVTSFQILGGSAGLVDRSVQPPALFDIADLDLRVRGLSNDVTARAQIEVQAKVGGAPLALNGTLSPRFRNDATNLRISSKGIDLTPLGPYFGKYVGYTLEKGKLDLDLEYRVAARQLAAQNLIKVDQLTLGEETHSPDATKLPVKLGLAILQDRDGLIELDVPVEGNVDDPDFRLGKVIWHAVGNVFTKIVTAPFAALGKLFGGGSEHLDGASFAAGSAAVDPAAEKTFQALAKALYSRPALKLEVEGTVDPASDGLALRRQALRKRAREAKWKAGKGGAASPDKVELLEDDYVKFIESEYRRTFPDEAKASKAAAPGVTEMEEKLVAPGALDPEAMRALAQQRAGAARDHILHAAEVDPSRLFIVQGGERATKDGGARVYFTLK